MLCYHAYMQYTHNMKTLYEHQVRRGSSKLVIFVHGFAGSPFQFDEFIQVVDEHQFDYVTIWVPGHGGTTKDFAAVTTKDWLYAATEVIQDNRAHYETIVVVAHSMGCLLTMQALQTLPIEGLIFWAPAIRTALSVKQLGTSIEIVFKKPDQLDPFVKRNASRMGVPVPTLLEAPLWTPRLISFLSIMARTRKYVATINCPVLVIASRNDETVPYSVLPVFQKKVKPELLSVLSLTQSTHAFFDDSEILLVQDATRSFLKQFK